MMAADLSRYDWTAAEAELDARGMTVLPGLLDPDACAALTARYGEAGLFRSTVTMARHGFGQGEYRYFAYPLPAPVQALRSAVYSRLTSIANRWQARMGLAARFSDDHQDFLRRCHAAGQARPTPLLLRYGPGDYNCLHQDLYGEHVFPLQAVVLLSRPGRDFTGGELVLTEQRPRMQSRVEVAALEQGDALVFAVNQRPVRGSKGDYRVAMRHGVSRLRAGERHTLGVIFHDAA